MVNGLAMGFVKKEIEAMRMGEYIDLFNAYKAVHNMRVEGMKYKLPEKRVSMLDL